VLLKFSDLFEEMGYSARCEALSGTEVEIAGYVVDTHDGSAQMLVAEPGGCPHCSQAAAVSLPGSRVPKGAVTLRGVLSYGFSIDGEGSGSFLRLEKARLVTGLPT
jgi:hypothetical protein